MALSETVASVPSAKCPDSLMFCCGSNKKSKVFFTVSSVGTTIVNTSGSTIPAISPLPLTVMLFADAESLMKESLGKNENNFLNVV